LTFGQTSSLVTTIVDAKFDYLKDEATKFCQAKQTLALKEPLLEKNATYIIISDDLSDTP
jgi:hypothetical protein